MRVTIDQVDSALLNVFDEIFGHVEASRSTANYREAELFVRLYEVLLFKLLAKFWIVIRSREKVTAGRRSRLWT